jgi:hypothetical protein
MFAMGFFCIAWLCWWTSWLHWFDQVYIGFLHFVAIFVCGEVYIVLPSVMAPLPALLAWTAPKTPSLIMVWSGMVCVGLDSFRPRKTPRNTHQDPPARLEFQKTQTMYKWYGPPQQWTEPAHAWFEDPLWSPSGRPRYQVHEDPLCKTLCPFCWVSWCPICPPCPKFFGPQNFWSGHPIEEFFFHITRIHVYTFNSNFSKIHSELTCYRPTRVSNCPFRGQWSFRGY